LARRADGYHDLKTVFQSLALFDNVTVTARRGPLAVTCDEPDIPTDQRNLVWKAASLLHRVVTGKTSPPNGIAIDLRKRVPSQAGLGGGSSNAAMTLLALNKLWKLDLDLASLTRIGARLGADVPYFLVGGTALGLGRGDDIYPLTDMPPVHVVILRPGFGVATSDAYTWFDEELRRSTKEPAPRALAPGWPAWSATLRNDLEIPVVRHHPAIRAHQAVAGRRRRGICGDVRVRIRGIRPVRAR
jgi:4-diphosphocytidyl-2-C-methyl-D-erythritol kinase